jgi:hypothetical protein
MADKQTKVNMVSSQSWRDHFKVDQSVLEAFWEDFSQNSPLRASEMSPSEAGNSIEFVLWCIQQGHFTEDAFVQWQSETLEIPVVRQAYFEAPVDTMFWDRVKEIHPWNATCMPLTEWDDVLLVAVANASAQNLSLSRRHRIVLAAPSRLREYFERVDQSTASKPVFVVAPPPQAEQRFEMPVAAPEQVVPVKTPAPTKTPAPAAAPADDGGDPFAALSRELGLLGSETPESLEQHEIGSETSSSEAPEGLVLPDGLVLPEGLDLGALGKSASPEISETTSDEALDEATDDSVNFDLRATEAPESLQENSAPVLTSNQATPEESENSASEGGTLIHNFETGKDEVVAKTSFEPEPSIQPIPVAPPPLNLNIEPDPIASSADVPVSPPASETPTPAPMAAVEASDKTSDKASIKASIEAGAVDTDNDDPLASLVMAAAPAKTTGKNSDIPDLPFSIPRHEPEQTPEVAAKEPITSEPATSEPPKTGRIRKPLFAPVDDAATMTASQPAAVPPPKTGTSSAFEPRSSKGAGFEATQAVSIQNNLPHHTNQDPLQDTQVGGKTGTFAGTQTKSRRLENTPVTSMLGTGQHGIHQERPEAPGGNPTYLNKSIAIGKLDPIHLDQCRSIDEAGAQAILQACNIYECAMILLFRGGDLVPWKWNDLFLSVRGDKPEPIDLVEPSIFKVVFRTAKPYHGYLVTSEVNQKFFNEFYRGMLPKHATITPLMIDGRMGGMVLGFTNSKVDYRQSLRLMERLSFDLARVFKSLRGTMAKAG